jgi:hypothetical protein
MSEADLFPEKKLLLGGFAAMSLQHRTERYNATQPKFREQIKRTLKDGVD